MQFLEAYISPRVAHLGHVGTAMKIVFDFCTIGPPLIFSFLYWSKFWESGMDHTVTLRHAFDRYPSTLLASYAFWAPLHFMTYGLVPLRHRYAPPRSHTLTRCSYCSVLSTCLDTATLLQCHTHALNAHQPLPELRVVCNAH
jgi:hypothetical protein